MSSNFKITLLFCLLAVTAAAVFKIDWHLGMAGMTAFFLAYLSKGMRRQNNS